MARRRRLLASLVFIAFCAAGGIVLLVTDVADLTDGRRLERWIARQITGAISHYINPKLAFDRIAYEPPFTVELTRLTLTRQDTAILEVDEARLTLARIPRLGEPIQIQEVRLIKPRLRLQTRDDGQFVGWSEFVKPGVIEKPQSVPKEHRLSDILVMRLFAIQNGQIEYRLADPKAPAMVFPDIDVTLNTPPDPQDPGSYKLDGALTNGELLQLTFDGRINLDTAILELKLLALSMDLDREHDQVLPPQVQDLLRTYDVTGALEANVVGRMPLSDWEAGELTLRASLDEGSASLDDAQLAVDRFELEARMAEHRIDVSTKSALLGGEIDISSRCNLEPGYPLTARWRVTDVTIEELYRLSSPDHPPYQGTITSTGNLTARLGDLPASLEGHGNLQVTEGTFGRLPLLDGVMDTLRIPEAIQNLSRGRDRANLVFAIMPALVRIAKGNIQTALLNAQIQGDIGYDQSLALEVAVKITRTLDLPNGELTAGLKRVGKLFDKLSRGLTTCHIGGTVGNPTIRMKPLGLKKAR